MWIIYSTYVCLYLNECVCVSASMNTLFFACMTLRKCKYKSFHAHKIFSECVCMYVCVCLCVCMCVRVRVRVRVWLC